ncbi:unnamed protein product [Phaedon cochleariae]|uniref:Uncharacterized protein n=1 Tax=Phaedon cochleariae TaxID=80249 RepID=A0A9N9SPG4_PHACE|nr:unnamed protein product [Phaedon cochleariae]
MCFADIKALRGKNKQLTQAVAKLQQDKKSQQDQITSLQEEFFNLNSKYVNLKNIFSNIDVAAKVMFPKQMELAEMFDPITQTVKPHIVNGHVLQNPTITLSRLNDSPSRTPPRPSGHRNNSPEGNMSQRRSNDRPTTSSEVGMPSSSRNTMREDDDREIRIFLDPLPKESIAAKNNVSHNRSYLNCSVPDEPSTSAMDVSRQILNSSLGSPDDTMKLITSAIDSQTFSFNTSTPLKSGYFQGNRSSTSTLNDSVDLNRVQMTRGKYGKSEEKPHKTELESNSTVMEG